MQIQRKKIVSLENIPVIHNFPYVIPKEITGLPPKRHRFHHWVDSGNYSSIPSSLAHEYTRVDKIKNAATRTT